MTQTSKSRVGSATIAMQAVRLMNIQETAKLLNVSVPFLYKAVRERRMPVTRIGRSLRFDPRQLERFLAGASVDVRE